VRVGDHTEPIFPGFPYISHIGCEARLLAPFQHSRTARLIAYASIEPCRPVLARPDHRLVAGKESKEKHHYAESQRAFWNRKPLPGDGAWRCKAQGIQCRSRRNE